MASKAMTPSPSKIPASIAKASKEELEKLLVSTLHKLKARDRQIAELERQVDERQNEERLDENQVMILQEGFAKERAVLEMEQKRVVEDLVGKEEALKKELEEVRGMLVGKEEEGRKYQEEICLLKATMKEESGVPQDGGTLQVDNVPDLSKYVAIEEYEGLQKDMAELKRKFAVVLKKQKKEEQQQQQQEEGPMYQQLKKEVEVERSRFKKALGELKRRNEGLLKSKEETDKVNADMEVQIEALRAEVMAESRKAQEAQTLADQSSLAFKEYKQRAHVLLKSKEEELKEGRFAVKEEFEKELAEAHAEKETLTIRVQELSEELEVLKSEVAEKVYAVEKKYKDQIADMKKDLEMHMEHARNSTRQYDQLRVRYDSFEDRYQSLKNELAEAKSVTGQKDSAEMEKLQALLDVSDMEKKSLQEVQAVMQGEIADLKAMVQQLKLTLAMKSSTLQATLSGSLHDDTRNYREEETDNGLHNKAVQEELASANRKALAAEREVDDLEKEVALHSAQAKALKETVRELERELERVKLASKTVDMEYFKNILLKLFETGEDESILPVVGTMLQFSPQELKRCQDAIASRQQFEGSLLPTDATATATNYISSLFGYSEE